MCDGLISKTLRVLCIAIAGAYSERIREVELCWQKRDTLEARTSIGHVASHSLDEIIEARKVTHFTTL